MADLEQCTYPGCASATERPATDGWTWFQDLASGLDDGFYCPAHSAAIEALNSEDTDRWWGYRISPRRGVFISTGASFLRAWVPIV
jgi:hypothetical protein